MATKLSQILGLASGEKGRAQKIKDHVHHQLQKPDLFRGLTKTYRPSDEEGLVYPDEGNDVALRAWELLDQTAAAMTRMFDLVATADRTNTVARADVQVDGTVVLADVPVTTLLFLAKQLADLHTMIGKAPVHAAGESWEFDDSVGAYASPPVRSFKTRKVPRSYVKYEATKEHPAQVGDYTEDIVEGTWTKIAYSGALTRTRHRQLLDRVEALQDAVQSAIQHANSTTDAVDTKIGKPVFDFLLAP